MSYDVDLVVNLGTNYSAKVFWVNYTSNLAPAWRHADLDLAALHGRSAVEARAAIGPAIARIVSDRPDFEQFEPDNGWGSVEGMIEFLRGIHRACLTHPHAVVHVSH